MDDCLSVDELHALMICNADTGELFWRKRDVSLFCDETGCQERLCSSWNARFAGRQALTPLDAQGYHRGKIFGRAYSRARVVWAMHHGKWPGGQIDHINGIRTDDRIQNLRDVPQKVNAQNRKRPSNNSSGTIGVSWHKYRKKWCAQANIKGKRTSLGYFTERQDAINARKKFEDENGYHQNHGRG